MVLRTTAYPTGSSVNPLPPLSPALWGEGLGVRGLFTFRETQSTPSPQPLSPCTQGERGERARNVLGRSRTCTSTFAGSRATSSTPRGHVRQAFQPDRRVRLESLTYRKYPGPDSNRDQGLRRSRCCPLHHQDNKSRRLDSHQHHPTYEIGAFLRRATSASRTVIPGGLEPPLFPMSRECLAVRRRDRSQRPVRESNPCSPLDGR